MPGKPALPAFRHPPASPDAPPTSGPWGCNAGDACTKPAVVQWAAPAPTDDDPLATVPVFACADHDEVA
jgi:hypothetical protein